MIIFCKATGLLFCLSTLALYFCCQAQACQPRTGENHCLDCHTNLEDPWAGHTPILNTCHTCHGGQPAARDKDLAHHGLYKNPASPTCWHRTCAKCHPYQLARIKSSLMYTNLGLISKIQATWGQKGQGQFIVQPALLPDQKGKVKQFLRIAKLNNLAGELYRKFCSRCHLSWKEDKKTFANHGSGCAACHFSYNNNATYQGNDPTLKGRHGYSQDHHIHGLPDNTICLKCHNRSGRVALTYQGLNEGNQSPVPFTRGRPAPPVTSGGRKLKMITPDAHFKAGLDCIDCHTSREIMGDGYVYPSLNAQLEIECKNCHGTGQALPEYHVLSRENESPMLESRQYAFQFKIGSKMILTAKKRPFSNVFLQNGKVFVLGKRSRRIYKAPLIKGSRVHTIYGHERLSCIACHSQAVPQCFGCHTLYDRRKMSFDAIKKRFTPGKFKETEDYRRIYPFSLALGQTGKIVPVTPGCQTMLSIVDRTGKKIKNDYVTLYKGRHQFRFAPFFSHNIQRQGPSCKECHARPIFLGLGQGRLSNNKGYIPSLICPKDKHRPLDGFATLHNGCFKPFAAIIGKQARPLNSDEIRRIWAVNLCLTCHFRATDPIYQKKLCYEKLSTCLARNNHDPHHTLDSSTLGPGPQQKTSRAGQ